MTTYAIGDIQGCFKSLQALLKRIDFLPGKDKLWLCGDLVNRGPDSLATLRYIMSLGDSAISVLGNHDLHLLAIASGASKARPKDTLTALLDAPDSKKLINWLAQRPLIHIDEKLGYCMVHAGIPPQWSPKMAERYAREVERILKGNPASAHTFFQRMYGNEPDQWHDDLSGSKRLRIITNYLTRMRFCNAKGRLELKSKGNAAEAPPNYQPWYQHRHLKRDKLNIVFGHWASLEGECSSPHIHALDTGCAWGGTLTAMNLKTGQRTKVSCHDL